MNKIFQLIGGRKFALTVASIIGGAAIDLMTLKGLSMPLATFMGAALAAFCASNYAVSKEYMRTEADKKKLGPNDLEKKLNNVLDKLNSIEIQLSISSDSATNEISQMKQVLVQVAEASGNALKVSHETRATLQAALNVAKKG
jgi:hypothetical protein